MIQAPVFPSSRVPPEVQAAKDAKRSTEQNDADYGYWLDVMRVASDAAVKIHGPATTPSHIDAMFLVMERRLRADAANPALPNTAQAQV